MLLNLKLNKFFYLCLSVSSISHKTLATEPLDFKQSFISNEDLLITTFQFSDIPSLKNVELTCTTFWKISQKYEYQIWKHCIPERILPFYSPPIYRQRPNNYFKSWRTASLLMDHIVNILDNVFQFNNTNSPNKDAPNLFDYRTPPLEHLQDPLKNIFLSSIFQSDNKIDFNEAIKFYCPETMDYYHQNMFRTFLEFWGDNSYELDGFKELGGIYVEIDEQYPPANAIDPFERYDARDSRLIELVNSGDKKATYLLISEWIVRVAPDLYICDSISHRNWKHTPEDIQKMLKNNKFVDLYLARGEVMFLNALDYCNLGSISNKYYVKYFEKSPTPNYGTYLSKLKKYALQGSLKAQYKLLYSYKEQKYPYKDQTINWKVLRDYFTVLNYILNSNVKLV